MTAAPLPWRHLGAVVVALGYLVLMLLQGGWSTREQFVAFEAAGLLDEEPSVVQAITLRAADAALELRRGTAGWTLAGRVVADDRNAAIEQALRYLHAVRPIRHLAAHELEPATAYGLDPATLELVVILADGNRRRFRFGAHTPTGAQQYVRVDGVDGVDLLSDFVGHSWQEVLEALR